MINPVNYVKNVGKSFGYAFWDSMKQINPTIKSAIETNQDIAQEMYAAVKDFKTLKANIVNKVTQNEYWQLGGEAKKYLFEDLKSGKWYNKERKDKIEDEMMRGMMGDDSFDFDDFNFDDGDGDSEINFEDSDDDSFDESWEQTNDMEDMMDTVGEKVTNGISTATVRSAEYIAESNKNIAKQNATFQSAMFGKVNAGLAAINANISNIIPMGEALNTHIQNSSVFFTKSTELFEKQTNLLEQIAKNTTPIDSKKETSKSSRKNIMSVLDSEGILDLSSYFDAVKENILDMTSSITSMGDMMGEGNNMFRSFIASPMEYLLTGAIKSMMPRVTRDMMTEFNKTLSGVFSSLFMKARDSAYSDNPVFSTLGKIFGVTDYIKTSVNTGSYVKSKVDFDGITRKAIVEVIPTYLAKILSVVSGQEENRYDYDRGKFVSRSTIESDKKRIIANEADFASYELKDLFNQYIQGRPDEKTLNSMFKTFTEKVIESGALYNPRSDENSMESFGLKDEAGEIINDWLKQLTHDKKKSHVLTAFNRNAIMGRSNVSNRYNSAESNGNDILNHVYNNSFDKDNKIATTGSPFNLNNIYDDKHNNIFYYLQGIYQYTQGMYEDGVYMIGAGVGNSTGAGIITGNNEYRPSTENTIRSGSLYLPSGIRRSLREIADNTPLNAPEEVKEEIMSDNDFDHLIKPLAEDPKMKHRVQEIIDKYGEYSNLINDSDKKSMIMDVLALKKEKEKKDKEKRENKQKAGIFDRMRESDYVSGKIKEIIYGVDDLLRTPATAVSKLVDSATVSINNLIYGKDDGDEEDGFLGYIFKETKKLFTNFNHWINEKILEPLADKFDIHSFGDLFKQVFNIFGVDLEQMKARLNKAIVGITNEDGEKEGGFLSGIINGTKADLKSSLSWGKNAFTNSLGMVKNVLTGKEEPAAAHGGYVSKTGMISVSEGELIIPSEYNPFYNKITNKAKQIKDESDAFNRFYGSFANGGTVSDSIEIGDNFRSISGGRSKGKRKKRDKKTKNKKDSSSDSDAAEQAREAVEKAKEEVSTKYKELKDSKAGKYVNESANTLKHGISSFLFGGEYTVIENGKEVTKKKKGIFSSSDDKKENKELKNFTNKAMKEIGVPENISGMLSGGLIGGAASFLTGGVISPLMGAALGAGAGLIIKSKAVQEALFGTEDKKGLLSKNVSDFIKNKLPTVGKFGLTGSLASTIMGFGPVTGLLVGSAAGIALQNETFMDRLLGPKDKDGNRLGGAINKDIQNRIKKAAPAMGAGALAGILVGPFGLVPNIVIGSAIGFASTSDKFQNAIFGEPDEHGNRDGNGGLVGYIRNDIFAPIKEAFSPIKQAVTHGFKNFSRTVSRSLSRAFKESIGVPLWLRLKEKMLDPFLNIIKKSKIVKHIGNLVSFIPKRIAGLGRGLRTSQIRKGIATDMTAAERIAYRNKHNLGTDSYTQMDEALNTMDKSALEEQYNRIKDLENKTKDQYKDLNKSINYKNLTDFGFKATVSEKIIKMAIEGDLKNANKRVEIEGAKIGLSGEQIKKAKDMVKKIHSDYKSKKETLGKEEQENFDKLSNMFGINVSRKNIDDIKDSFETEIKDRNKDKEGNKERKDNEFKTEIVDRATKIHQLLQDIHDKIIFGITKQDNRLPENREYETDEDGNPVMIDENGNPIEKGKVETPEFVNKTKNVVKDAKHAVDVATNTVSNAMAGTVNPAIGATVSGLANAGANVAHGAVNLASNTKNAAIGAAINAVNSDINGNETEDKKSLLEKIKEKFRYVPTSSGKLIKQKFNTSGDPIPDMSDKETRQTVIEEKQKTDAQIGIGETVGDIKTGFGSLIEKLFGKKDDEKKPNLFESLKKALFGEDGKGGLINNVKDLWKFFTNGGGPIAQTGFGKLLNNFVGPALFVGAFTGLFNDLFNRFGWGKDKNSTGPQDANGNAVTTDGYGHTINEFGQIVDTSEVTDLRTDTDNFQQKFQKSLVRGALTNTKTLGGTLLMRNSLIKKAATGISKRANVFSVDDAVALAANTQIGDDILNACTKFTSILRKIPICKNLANYLDDMGLELAENITKKLAGQGAKQLGKFASNLVVWAKVAYIIIDFTTGYEDARSTLGIVQQPTIGQRVVSGLLRAVKNFIPIIGPLIPDNIVVDVFCKFVGPAFGEDPDNLLKQREEAQSIVDQYNAENGTQLNVQQYNKEVLQDYTWTERIGNGYRGAWDQTKLKFKNAKDGIKEKGLVGYTKEVFSNMGNDFINAYKNSGGGISGIFEGVGATFRDMLPGIFGEVAQKKTLINSLAYKGNISEMWKIALDDFSQRETGPDGVEKAIPTMFSKFVGQLPLLMNKLIMTPVGLASAILKKLGIENGLNGVSKAIGKVLGGEAKEKVEEIKESDSEKIEDAKEKTNGIWSKINNFLNGKGTNFISQKDPQYANIKYSSSNMANEGCGPAAATMAINSARGNNVVSMRDSAAYARRNGFENNQGTSADYFGSMFNSNGLQAKYMTGGSTNEIVSEIASGHPTVLLGQDPYNTSKARSPFGAGNHYVVANGFDRNGNVIINDPELGRGNAVYSSNILKNVKLGISASGTRMKRKLYKQYRYATGGGDNRATCWAYFKQQGCSDEVAAAIIGNLMAESGCNPGSIEKGNGNAGFGIAQWSYGRRTAFEQYAASKGVRADDIAIQLQYLWSEIMGGEATWASLCKKKYGSIDNFIQSKNIDEATEFYCFKFERPNKQYAHLDRRISEAHKAYTEFSGKEITADFSNVQSTDTGDATPSASSSSNGNPLTTFMGLIGKLQSSMFGKVGALFGIGDSSTSDDTTTNSVNSGEEISANPPEITYNGNSPIEYMKSVQQKLAYSQTGPRNPEKGSADCSSTVQWAIKKATGVDIGGNTGAQITSPNLETVWSNNGNPANELPDNIKPNDVLFFSRSGSNRKFKVGHVELYTGDGKMIGHGGGKNGTTPGPTIKNVTTNSLVQVSRVKQSGAGSGLINGLDEVKKVGTYRGKVIPISSYQGGDSAIDTRSMMNTQIGKAINTINNGGNKEDLISLIKSIIVLLQTLTNNTSKVDTIAVLLKDYFNAKVKETSGSGTQQKTRTGKLVDNSSNSPIIINGGGSNDVPDLDTATKNMIEFLNELAVG